MNSSPVAEFSPLTARSMLALREILEAELPASRINGAQGPFGVPALAVSLDNGMRLLVLPGDPAERFEVVRFTDRLLHVARYDWETSSSVGAASASGLRREDVVDVLRKYARLQAVS